MEEDEKSIQIQIKNAKCYIYLNENLNQKGSTNDIGNKDTFNQMPNKKTIDQQTAIFTNASHELSLSDSNISYCQKNDLEITNKSIFESNKNEESGDISNFSKKTEEKNLNENINNKLYEDIKKEKILNNIELKNDSNNTNSNKNIFMYKNYNVGNIMKIKNELDSLSKYKNNCYNKIYNEKQKKLILSNNNTINIDTLNSMKCRSLSQKYIDTTNNKKSNINSKIIKKNYIFGSSAPKQNEYNYKNTPSIDKIKSFSPNLINNKIEKVDNYLKSNKFRTSIIERNSIRNINRPYNYGLTSLYRNSKKIYYYNNIKDFPNAKSTKLLYNKYDYRNNDKYKNKNTFAKGKE